MSPKPVHILLVDDDEVDAQLVIRGMRKAKINNEITVATDGVEAFEVLRGTSEKGKVTPPFIIILDWNMPRMNGSEFLEELRQDADFRESTVFVLTTSSDSADIAEAYSHLVAGYIVKDRAGADFVELVEMLDMYWKIVELPG